MTDIVFVMQYHRLRYELDQKATMQSKNQRRRRMEYVRADEEGIIAL